MIAKHLIMAAALVIATPAFAQAPRTVAEIAAYKGADRQAIFEQGARREGAVLVYGVGTIAEPVYEAFKSKYPFIQFVTKRGDTSEMTRLMLEEAAANTFHVDAVELTTGGLAPLRDAGMLQSYWSPELAAYGKEAVEPSNYWALDYLSFLSLGYNTNLVSDAEAPRTLDDLLDPKWKGKMGLPGTTTLANWIGAVLQEKDEAFIRKLGAQQIRIYEISARAVANLVISGEVPMSPATFNSHVADSRGHGAPIAWRALGGIFPTTDASALAARAPHPFAAMLFIDFILSIEGQKIFQKLGYSSARADLPSADKPDRVYYISDRPDYLTNYEKWSALGRSVFGGGKK